jgi:hypothetical protein
MNYSALAGTTLSISARMKPSEIEAPNSQKRFTVLRKSETREEKRGREGGLPVTGGGDHVLHLHGLQHDEVVARLDLVAVSDRELDHLARHGGLDHWMV